MTEYRPNTDYEKQATDFLAKHGLTFTAAFVGKNCPPFATHLRGFKEACPKCKDVHGWEYLISIRRSHSHSQLQFPFWNSWAGTHFQPQKTGDPHGERLAPGEYPSSLRDGAGQRVIGTITRRPTPNEIATPPSAYDVLACISSDAHCETDFVTWCGDYGIDTDSRRAEALHKRCIEFALKLRQFFTDAELTDLQDIN